MTPAILAMPGNEAAARSLASVLGGTFVDATVRRFPDGESYVRIDTHPFAADAAIVCTLDRPDEKTLALLYLAAAAREQGAKRLGLIAPYLAYLRQDRRFHDGEVVTSAHFARLLSRAFDWLVTLDPHLHRYRSLAEIYDISTRAVTAAPAVAKWIRAHVESPLLIGPDRESAQWVRAVASDVSAPFMMFEKTRRGDRDVQIAVPNASDFRSHTPVLLDDIISTAATMIESVRRLKGAGLRPPVCIGIHAVFADDAYAALLAAGPARVVTCNTIAHPTNAIDVLGLLADAVRERVVVSP